MDIYGSYSKQETYTTINIASGIDLSDNDIIPAAAVVQIEIREVCRNAYMRGVVLEAGIKGRDK